MTIDILTVMTYAFSWKLCFHNQIVSEFKNLNRVPIKKKKKMYFLNTVNTTVQIFLRGFYANFFIHNCPTTTIEISMCLI